MKELKDATGATARDAEKMWNPVKELKGILDSRTLTVSIVVESGEGIERKPRWTIEIRATARGIR